MENWKGQVGRIKQETYALYLAYRDPRTPWYARLFAAGVAGYAFSPVDLVPDFIPVLGYLDDLVLVPAGVFLALKMIPPEVMAECRERAREVMVQGKNESRNRETAGASRRSVPDPGSGPVCEKPGSGDHHHQHFTLIATVGGIGRPSGRLEEEMGSSTSNVRRGVARWLVREIFGSLFTAAILFGAAGRLDWAMGWVLVGVYLAWTAATALAVIPTNPQMLAERTGPKAGTKKWDMAIMGVVGVVELVKYVVVGLDMRYGWSPQMPLALQLVGVALVVLGYDVILVWAMATNAFFSQTVRIQKERGHTVVTGGPYRYVRHPGYVGSLLFQIGTPLMLGSVWAFIPSGLVMCLTIVRTALEDRTLQEELDGYRDYTTRVRYRLLPGVW